MRYSPSSPPTFLLSAPRNVYRAPFTVNGYAWYYSVTASGELLTLRTIPAFADPSGLLAELWAELDVSDPTPSGVVSLPAWVQLRVSGVDRAQG